MTDDSEDRQCMGKTFNEGTRRPQQAGLPDAKSSLGGQADSHDV